MTNQEWMDKYKLDNIVIKTKFADKDKNPIDGIVCPLKIDNRQLCSPTDNQGDSPHCAGYSAAQIAEAIYWKRTGKLVNMDAHQIYAKAKELDGHIEQNGTGVTQALIAALLLSAFRNKEAVQVNEIYGNGMDDTIVKVKNVIHKYDFILGGFRITDDWYNCVNGKYIINNSANRFIGGHGVVICGYDSQGLFIQNHWSKDWGAKGFAKIPWNVFKEEFLMGAYVSNAYAL